MRGLEPCGWEVPGLRVRGATARGATARGARVVRLETLRFKRDERSRTRLRDLLGTRIA